MRQAIVEACVARWRSRFFDIPLLVRYIPLFPDLDLDRILFAIHRRRPPGPDQRQPCRGLFIIFNKKNYPRRRESRSVAASGAQRAATSPVSDRAMRAGVGNSREKMKKRG